MMLEEAQGDNCAEPTSWRTEAAVIVRELEPKILGTG